MATWRWGWLSFTLPHPPFFVAFTLSFSHYFAFAFAFFGEVWFLELGWGMALGTQAGSGWWFSLVPFLLSNTSV